MKYTNNPLETGFCKMSVNYDQKDEGEVLRPRPGLRVKELGYFPVKSLPLEYTDDLTISSGKVCPEGDNRIYKQIIVGKPLDIPVREY